MTFFILRQFSTLTVRLLLALQDELSELECQLETLETELSAMDPPDIHNGSIRHESSEERKKLIHAVHAKLKEYHELAIKHSDLRGRPRVSKKNVADISHWFYIHNNAIASAEKKYIDQEKDLFTIVLKPQAPFRELLDRSYYLHRLKTLWRKNASSFRRWPLSWKKIAPAQEDDSFQDRKVEYFSDHGLDLFVAFIITDLGLLMLIVPLWILAFVTSTVYRLAIITLCVAVLHNSRNTFPKHRSCCCVTIC